MTFQQGFASWISWLLDENPADSTTLVRVKLTIALPFILMVCVVLGAMAAVAETADIFADVWASFKAGRMVEAD